MPYKTGRLTRFVHTSITVGSRQRSGKWKLLGNTQGEVRLEPYEHIHFQTLKNETRVWGQL